jgi:hypothetical protein
LRLSRAAESVRLAEQVGDVELQMLARRLRVVALLESGDVQAAEPKSMRSPRSPLDVHCRRPALGT